MKRRENSGKQVVGEDEQKRVNERGDLYDGEEGHEALEHEGDRVTARHVGHLNTTHERVVIKKGA